MDIVRVLMSLRPNATFEDNQVNTHSLETIGRTYIGGDIPTQVEMDDEWERLQADDILDVRRDEIYARLSAIDVQSIRALRSKGVGRGKPQDDTTLTALDDEADALRLELVSLI